MDQHIEVVDLSSDSNSYKSNNTNRSTKADSNRMKQPFAQQPLSAEAASKQLVLEMVRAGYTFYQIAKETGKPKALAKMFKELGLQVPSNYNYETSEVEEVKSATATKSRHVDAGASNASGSRRLPLTSSVGDFEQVDLTTTTSTPSIRIMRDGFSQLQAGMRASEHQATLKSKGHQALTYKDTTAEELSVVDPNGMTTVSHSRYKPKPKAATIFGDATEDFSTPVKRRRTDSFMSTPREFSYTPQSGLVAEPVFKTPKSLEKDLPKSIAHLQTPIEFEGVKAKTGMKRKRSEIQIEIVSPPTTPHKSPNIRSETLSQESSFDGFTTSSCSSDEGRRHAAASEIYESPTQAQMATSAELNGVINTILKEVRTTLASQQEQYGQLIRSLALRVNRQDEEIKALKDMIDGSSKDIVYNTNKRIDEVEDRFNEKMEVLRSHDEQDLTQHPVPGGAYGGPQFAGSGRATSVFHGLGGASCS